MRRISIFMLFFVGMTTGLVAAPRTMRVDDFHTGTVDIAGYFE